MDEYVFDYLPPKNKAKKVNYASEHGFTLETLPPSFAVFNKMEHRYPLKYPNPEVFGAGRFSSLDPKFM